MESRKLGMGLEIRLAETGTVLYLGVYGIIDGNFYRGYKECILHRMFNAV